MCEFSTCHFWRFNSSPETCTLNGPNELVTEAGFIMNFVTP